MQEWWAVANGPALWISGFILGGLAIVGALFMQKQAIEMGKKIGFGMDKVNQVRKSAFITSVGPGLGITFGMIPLMIALSKFLQFCNNRLMTVVLELSDHFLIY